MAGGLVKACETTPRLYRADNNAGVVNRQFDDVVSAIESCLGLSRVAADPFEAEVSGYLGPDRCSVDRMLDIGNQRQIFKLNVDALSGVERLRGSLSDDSNDRLADVNDLIGGKYRLRRLAHWLAVYAVDWRAGRQMPDTMLSQVIGGEDQSDPGRRLCLPGIEPADQCMRYRGAEHRHMQLTGRGLIIDKPPCSGQQRIVFDSARHPLRSSFCPFKGVLSA